MRGSVEMTSPHVLLVMGQDVARIEAEGERRTKAPVP